MCEPDGAPRAVLYLAGELTAGGIDVFAARALSGNPLAVVFDAETLDDDEMARRTCGARTPGARRARSSRSAAPAWSGCGWTPTAPWRSGDNVPEDPVTGSLNAAIAQCLRIRRGAASPITTTVPWLGLSRPARVSSSAA